MSCQGTQSSDAGLELLASSLTSWSSVGLDAEVIPNSQVSMMKVYMMPPVSQIPKGQKSKIFQAVQHRRCREGDLPDRARRSVSLSLTLLSPCLHSGCSPVAPVCSTKVLNMYFIFLSSLTSSSQGSNLRRELGKA